MPTRGLPGWMESGRKIGITACRNIPVTFSRSMGATY